MFRISKVKTAIRKIVKNKFKLSLNNKLKPVIIKPDEMLPRETANKDFQKPNPKNTATAVPVHTPVSGSGIATNKKTPTILIISSVFLESAFLAFFLTLSALDWNKLSTAFASPRKIFIFLKSIIK